MAEAALLDNVSTLLAERRWAAARSLVDGIPAQDVSELLLELPQADRVFLFKLLPRRQAAEVFSYLSAEDKDKLLADLTDEVTRQILADLSPDDRTALFQELPASATQRLMALLSPQDLHEAWILLGYPPESVGRLMTPDYIAVRADWSIEEALNYVRRNNRYGETINVIYVTDHDGRLLDALSIRRFIMGEPDDSVESLMDRQFIALPAYEDREKAVETIQHYDLAALPVVDSDGILLGIVTVDDVMDVAEEEATEDFHKLGSVGVLNLSLSQARPGLLYRRRIGWLILLVLVNIFGSAAIASFEETIEKAVTLVFFLPLIVASGGNAGTQSATLMVRALATGDVRSGDWLALWGKELGVASALGITMGLAVAALGLWRGGPEFGLVLALAMIAVVVMGSMLGMLLPFVLERFNMDPATASAPLVTSIADIAGIIVYFSVATAILTLP